MARANGWWTIYDPVEDLIEPDELAAALDADPGRPAAHWDALPPERAQGDAVVGDQRRQARHPGPADRDDRREGRHG